MSTKELMKTKSVARETISNEALQVGDANEINIQTTDDLQLFLRYSYI